MKHLYVTLGLEKDRPSRKEMEKQKVNECRATNTAFTRTFSSSVVDVLLIDFNKSNAC